MRIAGKLDPQNLARYQRASNLVNMNRAEAVDKYTVRVIMDAPSSAFFNGVADWRNSVAPEELVEIGFEDASKFVGTGPFTIDVWDNNGQQAEFRRNPDYWRKDVAGQPLPYIDSIRWNYLPDAATILSAFIAKNIDWNLSISKTTLETVQRAFKEAILHKWTYGNWSHFRINNTRQPLDDARVRKALQLAFDYKAVNDAYYGEGDWDYTGVLNAAFPEAIQSDEIAKMPGWNPATKQQDIERAKQLMSEAGYPDGAFAVRILQSSAATTGYGYETSIRAQDQFKQIWPNMTIDIDLPPDGATFARRQAQSDFDIISYTIYPYADAVIDMTANHHSKGSRNYGKFSNPDIDAGLEAALVEISMEQRAALLRDLQLKLINDFMPNLYLAMPKVRVYGNPRIKGFEGHSGPGSFGLYDTQSFADRYWIA
jgi:ABC-type transport system substrate-binding protein